MDFHLRAENCAVMGDITPLFSLHAVPEVAKVTHAPIAHYQIFGANLL